MWVLFLLSFTIVTLLTCDINIALLHYWHEWQAKAQHLADVKISNVQLPSGWKQCCRCPILAYESFYSSNTAEVGRFDNKRSHVKLVANSWLFTKSRRACCLFAVSLLMGVSFISHDWTTDRMVGWHLRWLDRVKSVQYVVALIGY